MGNYDIYFLMKAEDVPAYIRCKLPSFFSDSADLICDEIGDGNLNYVFRVKDTISGKTLIVKQAAEELRISKELKLSTDRGRIEAKILALQGELVPGFVPEVYLYDPVMCAMAMEEMIGHEMMRTALMDHKIFPKFADQIYTFLVNTLLLTSDIVMDHKKKEELVREFINPDLCDLTHHLVYSEPYLNYNYRNNVFAPNAEFVEKEIYEDTCLRLAAAKLKFQFMNDAQSLIHGDLHTGSIFINEDHIYVFDPEFAFYGPMSYDIGNVLANLFFAWCNGDALITDPDDRNAFCGWIIDAIADTVDLFIKKFKISFLANVTDPMAETPGFIEFYLDRVLTQSAGAAGIEIIRRTIGMANVKDITSIEDAAKRTRAERILITFAKDCIMNRSAFVSGSAYKEAINKAVRQF